VRAGKLCPLVSIGPWCGREGALTTDALEWLKIANQARAIAKTMHDPVSKQHMLDIAANYDALAERAASLATENPDFRPADVPE
jgi:hypothetical protein